MIFVTIWFFVDAHKWFKGPKINIEVCQEPLPFQFCATTCFANCRVSSITCFMGTWSGWRASSRWPARNGMMLRKPPGTRRHRLEVHTYIWRLRSVRPRCTYVGSRDYKADLMSCSILDNSFKLVIRCPL